MRARHSPPENYKETDIHSEKENEAPIHNEICLSETKQSIRRYENLFKRQPAEQLFNV